ncbi:hypothetical protein [Nannocystis sp.]|uniref:hypothetical protein n=1 Tax=Nannocystis sp. TaxID=1962667 RepID=UPI0025E17C3A|nr:hypothetical protein [Nannocystis sp.]MBK7825831.1 hypothetical protein [Nannocystis sp.]
MSVVLALVLVVVAPAEGLRLVWDAAPGASCPDQAALRGRVAAMLGPGAIERTDLTATASVRAVAAGWRLELELARAAGSERRTLTDRDCAALADAAALMIAVAIDPLAALAEAPVGPVPQDRAADPVEVVVPPPPDPRLELPVPGDRGVVPVPEDRLLGAVPEVEPAEALPRADVPVPKDRREVSPRGLQLGLRAGAGVGFTRILPRPHATLELGLSLAGRGWRVELNGGFAPPVRATASGEPAIGGVFRLGFGELRGCGVPALLRAPIVFPLCAGLQVGAMYGRGEGSGLKEKLAARSLWLATRLGGALRWRPRDGRVGLWLGLDAIVAITRPSFETAGGVAVHAAARVGGQASVGLELRLR